MNQLIHLFIKNISLRTFILCSYITWFQNLLNSFALLDDYQIWRPLNYAKQSGVYCYPGRGRCACHVDEMKNIMYRIISANVFFNIHYN